MKVADVANEMGVSPQYVRIGLQRGQLPFGYAIKTSNRWTYYINEEQFKKFMAGEYQNDDISQVVDRLDKIIDEFKEIKMLLHNLNNRK